MRFKFAIFGIMLQAALLVAQDPAPPAGTPLPPIRGGRPSAVFTPAPATNETPSPVQPNPNGLPAGQQQPAPVVAQPKQGAPSQPLPGQQGMPVPGDPSQALAQPTLPPPTPPQVTYRDGQLTVHAMNSTLGSVLAAIRNKTGIQFEGLDTASERIVVSMGPASEGEVLAAILTGSHYDYIAVDRSDSPGIVQRVILTPRIGGPAPPTIGAGQPATSSGEEEEAADDDPDNARNPQDTPARPPIMQAQPIPPQPNPQPQGEQPTIKTPEQYVEELKQIQQRQQQQQQSQAPQKVPQ